MPRLNPQKVETQTAHNLRYLSYIIGAVFLVVVIGLVLLVVRTIRAVNRWVSGRRRTH